MEKNGEDGNEESEEYLDETTKNEAIENLDEPVFSERL